MYERLDWRLSAPFHGPLLEPWTRTVRYPPCSKRVWFSAPGWALAGESVEQAFCTSVFGTGRGPIGRRLFVNAGLTNHPNALFLSGLSKCLNSSSLKSDFGKPSCEALGRMNAYGLNLQIRRRQLTLARPYQLHSSIPLIPPQHVTSGVVIADHCLDLEAVR